MMHKKVEEKRIEVVRKKVSELNTAFGNPRKIDKKKFEELKQSMLVYGDFGIFLIDENDSVIAGNQRLAVLQSIDPDTEILCKRLVGYTQAELRAINIRDNIHAGEWDIDLLAQWDADLNLDLGLKNISKEKELNERKLEGMECINFEAYDYVLIVCKTNVDYSALTEKLGLTNKVVDMGNKRTRKARAVWFHQIEDKLK